MIEKADHSWLIPEFLLVWFLDSTAVQDGLGYPVLSHQSYWHFDSYRSLSRTSLVRLFFC